MVLLLRLHREPRGHVLAVFWRDRDSGIFVSPITEKIRIYEILPLRYAAEALSTMLQTDSAPGLRQSCLAIMAIIISLISNIWSQIKKQWSVSCYWLCCYEAKKKAADSALRSEYRRKAPVRILRIQTGVLCYAVITGHPALLSSACADFIPNLFFQSGSVSASAVTVFLQNSSGWVPSPANTGMISIGAGTVTVCPP